MRKYIRLTILLLCLHIAARGQTIVSLDDIDLSGLPQPTQAKAMRYWFDDDGGSVQTVNTLTGTHTLDVSSLIEGLHTLHYQLVGVSNMTAYIGSAIFLKVNSNANAATAKSLRYWFDDEEVSTESILSGDIRTIDVSALLDGLHTIHYQVVGNDGKVYYVASALFFKTGNSLGSETVAAQKLMYWFDDDTTIQLMDIGEGVQLLDASALIEGLHTLHYQVLCNNGQMTPAMSTIFLRMNDDAETATAKSLRYWFDDEQTAKEVEVTEGVQLLDASDLIEGLHTVHYQIANSNNTLGAPYSSIFLKMNWDASTTTAKALRYWYDDELTATETAISNGSQTLDASRLIEGLHTIHYQIVDSNGTLGSPASSVFLKMDASDSSVAKNVRYWFDDDATTVSITSVAGGTQTLDVSALKTGLHTLNYQLIDNNGKVSVPVTRLFLKNFDKVLADGHNRVTKYQYWLNKNSQAMQTVELDAAANPYTLIALLPMQKEPIQSSQFHFEVTNDVPTIYAKNTLHVRFYDAQNYFTDGDKPFVDYSVKQEVEPVGELQSTQSFSKVAGNEIRWYTMQVAPGDTTAFRVSQPATVQVFAPSGMEVFNTSESASVQWNGIHTWEEGTYYLAVHDVTGSQNTMTLDYMHMDKYDVVDWDVHTVGNGGCSTITFKGNGFRDLYAVDLVIAPGDTIHSVDVGHESDAETSVIFDFTGAVLGNYDALFHFTQEDKAIANVVTVEEAVDIELATNVSFPSTFLRGTSTTYTIKITNKGNMTAYDIPIYVYVSRPSRSSISKIDLNGKKVKDLSSSIYADSIDAEVLAVLDSIANRQGLMAYLLTSKDISDNSSDSVFVSNGYIWQDVQPNSTATISLTLYATENVNVWFTVPDYLSARHVISSQGQTPLARRKLQSTTREWDEECVHVKEVCYSLIKRLLNLDPNVLNGTGYITSRRKSKDNNEDCEWTYKRIPDCPPVPSGGGGSGAVNSLDPNDIYGYLAESGSKYLADSVERVNYIIEFENDPTFAEASAHTIVIKDTLDSRYFELQSFLPTTIKLGSRETFFNETDVITQSGVTGFLKTIDMRPEINAIAQVEGEYSQQTGIAEWRFTSLDPMTMEPTDDLMQGILPVNYDGTSGIGEVMYEIGVKPNKADGTEIPNRAGIVFDYEEAILTPTWTNIVDATAPESHVADVKMATDTTAAVRIEATDELSGPWRYDVYVQYGSGAWFLGAENVPIDKTASVKVYEGINHGFYTVVTDSAGNVEQKSAAREFTLDVFAPQVETNTKIQLAEGWNWMSQNQNTALSAEVVKPKAQRIMSQTEELYKDVRFGWSGDLDELLPTQMYKVQMAESAEVQLSGLLFNAAFRSVPLREGWNWIGYPVAQIMTVAEAFAKAEAEEGDALIGRDGLAAYSDGQWMGTLTEMKPGKGYMYRSVSDKNLFLNATAQASSRRANVSGFRFQVSCPDDWTVDMSRYPNVMGVVAELHKRGETVDPEEWLVAAFSDDECRGLAQAANGVLMMNVFGRSGEVITFRALHRESGEIVAICEQEAFRADLLGSMRQPYTLTMGELTGIVDIKPGKVSIDDASVFDLQGRKVNANQKAKGVYIVTDGKNSRTQKTVRK